MIRASRSSSIRNQRKLQQAIEPLEQRMLLAGDLVVTILHDANGNGVKDPEEPQLQGWTVFVDYDRNGVLDAGEPSAITDVDGDAFINGLVDDTYDVRQVIQPGWAPTTGYDLFERVRVRDNQTTDVLFMNVPTTATGTVTGVVWNDVDGDGVRDASDPGLPGWTVYLDENDDRLPSPGEPSTVTDATGSYTLTDLPFGQYKLREVVQTGWDTTIGQDSGNTVDITPGSTIVSNFGNFNVASIGSLSGTVWNDVNADGARAAGDVGLEGWTVFLDTNLDGALTAGEPSAVTDAAGTYAFNSIIVGSYSVVEVLQSGWNTSPGYAVSRTVNVVSESNTRADFANYTPTLGSISGRVWNDVNADGSIGAEPGLAGWTVFIDQDADGAPGAGEPTAVTDATGIYTLAGVPVGSNVVRTVTQVGWSPTAPGTGMQLVTVPNAGSVANVNFGNKQRTDGAISGVVFFDANKNGTRDAGERGLAGITIYLDKNDNGAPDAGEPSVVSSADLFYTPGVDETGAYSFTHLPAGMHIVRQVLPAVLSATPAAAQVRNIDLVAGEDRKNVNFADVFRPNEIHGMVFDDTDKDHVRDAGEAGVGGVTVYIDIDRDNVYDAGEPKTVTAADGSYSFTTDLTPGSYVLRELRQSKREHSYPTTTGGILWPSGVSNPAIGNVTPGNIQTSLAKDQSETHHVSLTLPGSGALTNMVDVFLLFDDTGSFTNNSPIVRAAFPQIISSLQTAMPTVDFGFGVGRFEEYANFAGEYATGRPFVLNHPIVAASTPGFSTAIQAALNRTAPGYGGDTPETDFEALFQTATGRGFDGNNNGTTGDSGAAGMVSTQLTPGNSGDVPSFASFTVDPTGNVLPAAGTIGGAGFRAGALPIILVATDTGFAFQPLGNTTVTGINGLTLPISQLTQASRSTTPFSSGAGIQETITALNALGALVIGLGTNAVATADPRQGLEAIAKLTGATNRTLNTIPNGTADPIAPGDPFYFQISSGFGASVANGVVAAIQNGISNVAVNIAVRASDPRVLLSSTPGVVNNVGAGQTAAFDVTFTGDGRPHRFDLQFVRQGTDVVLGSIPVVLGTPIVGDGYEYDEIEDGEIEIEDDFGSWINPLLPANAAPSFTKGADQVVAQDSGSATVTGWATNISVGTPAELDQIHEFIVEAGNPALFAVQPAVAPDGTLTFTAATGASGVTTITVRLHDSGGTVDGGEDTSAPQTFTITVTPAALTVTPAFDYQFLALRLRFSADVGASLTSTTAQVIDRVSGLPVTSASFSYDPATWQATMMYDPATMIDGDYRATIPAGTLPNQLSAFQYDFFVLEGDVNRDRTVSFTDLLTVAANFGKTDATAAQGDLNGDGQVSFVDLLKVAAKFGNSLAAPAAASPAPLAAAAVPAKPAPRAAVTPPVFSTKRVKKRDVLWR